MFAYLGALPFIIFTIAFILPDISGEEANVRMAGKAVTGLRR